MNDKCNHAEKGLAAFLLGALIGAAVGVMYAPAKGETTRRKLKRWADDTYEEQKEHLLEHASDMKAKIKEHAVDLRDKLAGHAEDAREKLAEGKDKVVKEFNKHKDELASRLKKDDKEI